MARLTRYNFRKRKREAHPNGKGDNPTSGVQRESIQGDSMQKRPGKQLATKSMEQTHRGANFVDSKDNSLKLTGRHISLAHNGFERLGFVNSCIHKQMHLVTFTGETISRQVSLIAGMYQVLSEEQATKLQIRLEATYLKDKEAFRKCRDKKAKIIDKKRPWVTSTEDTDENPVGCYISVRWPKDGKNYTALVIGSYKMGAIDLYKIYYIEDGSIEVLDLRQRYWEFEEVAFDNEFMGKRLFVLWNDAYEFNHEDQRKAEKIFGLNNTQIPYEGFVVQHIELDTYKIVYPYDNTFESFKLDTGDVSWGFLTTNQKRVNGLGLLTWAEKFER